MRACVDAWSVPPSNGCDGLHPLNTSPASSEITLGLLAGGRASRLGGVDKAWLERDGVPQVLRLARRFEGQVQAVLVSANRDPARYALHGLETVADRATDAGPIAGLESLAVACRTQWLLTLPVDLIGVNECLIASLASAAGEVGAFAIDDDGVQPLVALWPTCRLRDAASDAILRNTLSVNALQATLGMNEVQFAGVRFGNLNTPTDLAAAGVPL